MTISSAPSQVVLQAFEGPWRDDMPVFGCCRKAVAAAVEDLDLVGLAAADVTGRVTALRENLESRAPGHLATHRCCAGHLANIAFDLPELVQEAERG